MEGIRIGTSHSSPGEGHCLEILGHPPPPRAEEVALFGCPAPPNVLISVGERLGPLSVRGGIRPPC